MVFPSVGMPHVRNVGTARASSRRISGPRLIRQQDQEVPSSRASPARCRAQERVRQGRRWRSRLLPGQWMGEPMASPQDIGTVAGLLGLPSSCLSSECALLERHPLIGLRFADAVSRRRQDAGSFHARFSARVAWFRVVSVGNTTMMVCIPEPQIPSVTGAVSCSLKGHGFPEIRRRPLQQAGRHRRHEPVQPGSDPGRSRPHPVRVEHHQRVHRRAFPIRS